MQIQNTNSATIRLHDAECMADGYQVSFNGDGAATVRSEVGDALAEKYPTIDVIEEEPPPDDDPPPDGGGESGDGSGGDGGESADDNSDTNGSDTEQ